MTMMTVRFTIFTLIFTFWRGKKKTIFKIWHWFFYFFIYFRSRIEKTNYRQKEKQVLDSILGKGYDKRIRPSGKNDTGKTRLCFYWVFGRVLKRLYFSVFKNYIIIRGSTVIVLKKEILQNCDKSKAFNLLCPIPN